LAELASSLTHDHSLLARMASRHVAPVADVPLTSSRAFRVAMTRAADKALGLSLTVSSVGEEMTPHDGLLEGVPPDYLYAALVRTGEFVGLLGIDTQMRAAAIEMQTMGKLANIAAQDRPPTGTDMMLVRPLCEMLLAQLEETTLGSELAGWSDGVKLGPAFDSLRAAGLALEEADFRLIRLSLDLGVAERLGEIVMALPNHQAPSEVVDEKPLDQSWDKKMHFSVSAAPATLSAILHKMTLPLRQVDNLKVGDVLPLYGAGVGSVRLYAPEGVMVSEARLGQSGGKRAVRIETPAEMAMRDLPAPQARAAAEVD